MDSRFHKDEKVLILDFDHTLYDTDALLLFEMRHRILDLFKINQEVWESTYEAAVMRGYTLKVHGEEIAKVLGKDALPEEAIEKLEEAMDFSKYLYPDTVEFINKAKEAGYKTMILSFGAESWQKKKIHATGLDSIVDVIKYTREQGGKVGVIGKYTEGCRKVMFIDNSAREIDNVRRFLPYIETYIMNRVPPVPRNKDEEKYMQMRYMESRKMSEKKPAFLHKKCKDLNEVKI